MSGPGPSSAPPTEGVFETVVPPTLGGERVDRAVALLTGLPRSAVQEMVDEGRVAVDGRPSRCAAGPW